MPVLANAKHELFAQDLARGNTAKAAYVAAGYQDDDGNASKLAAQPEIRSRVQEITGAAAERAGVTAERVIAELAKIAFADIRNVVTWRPEVGLVEGLGEGDAPSTVLMSRVTVLDSGELSQETASAVAEVSQGASGSLKVKMHDKTAALEKLGRHLGIFKDRVEHSGPNGGPIQITDEQRAKALEMFLAKHKPKTD